MKKDFKLLKAVLIISICVFLSLPLRGQIDENFRENRKKARKAVSVSECKSSLKFCNEVLKVIPNQPRIIYLAARLNEQLGNSSIALKHLKKVAKLGYTSQVRFPKFQSMNNDPVFSALRKKKEFKEIIQLMNIADKPIHKSQIAFSIKDKSVIPEGITYDPVDKMFYLGSFTKIVKVDQGGKNIDFTKTGKQDGLSWVNGIHIDPVRRTLWACSNDEEKFKIEIFKYNLSSGKLIKKYSLVPDGARHMFNDLVIHPNGDVYISDSWGGIYMIPHSSDKLEEFMRFPIISANGITLSDDNRILYVADEVNGICKIDIKTKAFARLTHKDDFNTYGIDGLYFKDNYLYAVQSMLLPKVSRFSLNKDASHLESCEVFEKNTPDLGHPTTGVFVNDFFYYIADGNWEGKNPRGVVIMKVGIK